MSAQIALAEDVELVQQLESLQLEFVRSGNVEQRLQVVMVSEDDGVGERSIDYTSIIQGAEAVSAEIANGRLEQAALLFASLSVSVMLRAQHLRQGTDGQNEEEITVLYNLTEALERSLKKAKESQSLQEGAGDNVDLHTASGVQEREVSTVEETTAKIQHPRQVAENLTRRLTLSAQTPLQDAPVKKHVTGAATNTKSSPIPEAGGDSVEERQTAEADEAEVTVCAEEPGAGAGGTEEMTPGKMERAEESRLAKVLEDFDLADEMEELRRNGIQKDRDLTYLDDDVIKELSLTPLSKAKLRKLASTWNETSAETLATTAEVLGCDKSSPAAGTPSGSVLTETVAVTSAEDAPEAAAVTPHGGQRVPDIVTTAIQEAAPVEAETVRVEALADGENERSPIPEAGGDSVEERQTAEADEAEVTVCAEEPGAGAGGTEEMTPGKMERAEESRLAKVLEDFDLADEMEELRRNGIQKDRDLTYLDDDVIKELSLTPLSKAKLRKLASTWNETSAETLATTAEVLGCDKSSPAAGTPSGSVLTETVAVTSAEDAPEAAAVTPHGGQRVPDIVTTAIQEAAPVEAETVRVEALADGENGIQKDRGLTYLDDDVIKELSEGFDAPTEESVSQICLPEALGEVPTSVDIQPACQHSIDDKLVEVQVPVKIHEPSQALPHTLASGCETSASSGRQANTEERAAGEDESFMQGQSSAHVSNARRGEAQEGSTATSSAAAAETETVQDVYNTSELCGCGILFEINDLGHLVISDMLGSALDCGLLQVGDILSTIDRKDVRNHPFSLVAPLLLGQPGSKVQLGVERLGVDELGVERLGSHVVLLERRPCDVYVVSQGDAVESELQAEPGLASQMRGGKSWKRKKMRLLDLPPDSPMLLPSPQRARLKGDSASGPGYTGVYDLLLLTMIGLSAVLYVSAIHFEVVQVSAEAQAMLAQLAALWIGMMFSLAGIFFLTSSVTRPFRPH